MTNIVPKSLFLLMVIWFLIGVSSLPAQAYNSPEGCDPPDSCSPNVSKGGHPWITNKAIEYLKVIAPDAYLLANQYREQLIDGAWYADNNSGRCIATGAPQSWACDSTNHYEPQFSFHPVGVVPGVDPGVDASVSASRYATDLFSVADNCWSSRDPESTLADWYLLPGGLPEGSLPNSCRVPQWRAIDDKWLFGDFGQFSHDGPLVRIPPLSLLGWVLHMVQDVTQVYHTYSTPNNGHSEFEKYVDLFIQAGNADKLPDNTAETSAETSLEVSIPGICGWREQSYCGTPRGFVQYVANETQKVAKIHGVLLGRLGGCCEIPKDQNQLDKFTESSLNRAIIYSAKLLSFYFRRHGATELYNAVLIATVF